MLLIRNIGELVTMSGIVETGSYVNIEESHLGCLKDAWILLKDGKIKDYGNGPVPTTHASISSLDAEGGLVLPGLIDSHTHPLFAGDRSHEFAARVSGKTYQDIAAEGGGIRYTIATTRAASDDELLHRTQKHLQGFLQFGVTTLECKTGYGQSPQEEVRHLEIINQLQMISQQHLEITYLGLHATPRGITDKGSFVETMTAVLEEIKSRGLASWVDAFVENGYFSVGECQRYFLKAKELGFKIRIHADEFNDSGAATAAARWQAYSADHLEECSPKGRKALADAGVIATLLPGTSLYSKIKFAPGQEFVAAGIPIALATDFNPGSCTFASLPFIASLGALYCQINLPTTLAAVTAVAAKSLGLQDCKGALGKGFDGDLLIHPCGTKEAWLADFGQTKPSHVFIAGKQIIGK